MAPAFIEPLAQLTSIALAENLPDLALSRVTSQIALQPRSGGLQYLLGMVRLAQKEPELAGRAFLRAIELDPNLVDAYIRLGNIYRASQRYDEALARLNQALKVDPLSLSAQMLAGTIYELKGDIPRAEQAYEKTLAMNSSFAPAANNLAYLYSEHGGDKERALQLALRAKEAAPDDPRISDTLGWILYNRGIYQRAFALLRESAAKLPDDPVIQYHFGLAAMKLGDRDSARNALIVAVSSPANFAERENARRALAGLQ
jgi:tetratricopeptide (TPR) repeat protein